MSSSSSCSLFTSFLSFQVIVVRHGLRIDDENRDYRTWNSSLFLSHEGGQVDSLLNPWDPPLSREGKTLILTKLIPTLRSNYDEYGSKSEDSKINPWKVGKIYTSPFLRCLESSFLLASFFGSENPFISSSWERNESFSFKDNHHMEMKNPRATCSSNGSISIIVHKSLHEHLTESNLNQDLTSKFSFRKNPNLNDWFYKKYETLIQDDKNLERNFFKDDKERTNTISPSKIGKEESQRKSKGNFSHFPETLENCQKRFLTTFYEILNEHSMELMMNVKNHNHDYNKKNEVQSSENGEKKELTACENQTTNNENEDPQSISFSSSTKPNVVIVTHGVGVKIILEEVLRNRNNRIVENFTSMNSISDDTVEAKPTSLFESGFFFVKGVECNGFMVIDVGVQIRRKGGDIGKEVVSSTSKDPLLRSNIALSPLLTDGINYLDVQPNLKPRVNKNERSTVVTSHPDRIPKSRL